MDDIELGVVGAGQRQGVLQDIGSIEPQIGGIENRTESCGLLDSLRGGPH